MEVLMKYHTPEPQEVLKQAYSQCYQKQASIATVLRHIQHMSVLEHVSYTFNIRISRVAWEQLVRHRTGKFTAQSHRYTEPTFADYAEYIPPGVEALGEEAIKEWKSDMLTLFNLYHKWRAKGVQKQDARYLSPKGVAIRAQVTFDLRNLINFLSLRLDRSAQQEIREVAQLMWDQVKVTIPDLAETIETQFLKGGNH